MKPKLLNTIVFFIITPLIIITLILLILTFLTTMKAKNIGVEREDVSMISSHPDTIIDIHDLDAEYRNFKIYEMNIMEKNTHDLFKSTEESKETKAFNEKATTPSKNNLKIENTQLIAGFTYQMKNTDWKKFKSNFSINFERMMVLSFSELFDGTTKL